MAYYRLYTIGTDGRFRTVAAIDVQTDVKACENAAVRLNGGPGIEVWQEARRVALVTRDGTLMFDPVR